MSTFTIRVDRETHALLTELSEERGASLTDTVRDAAEALRRQRFAHRAASETDAVRPDDVDWRDYVVEADGAAVADGFD